MESLTELKEQHNYLETTPFYMGKDGLPSMALIMITILSGFLIGITGILTYRYFKKKLIRKKILCFPS